MNDYRHLATQLAESIASVAAGLRLTAGLFAAGSGAGALAGGVGVILLGAPPVLGLLLGLALALPIIGLWRLRVGLALVGSLPERVRAVPGNLHEAQADLGDLAAQLSHLRATPQAPQAFVATLRTTVRAYQRLHGLSPTHVVSAGLSLNPATVLAGTASALWAAGTSILGAGILMLGLLIG